MIYREEGDQLIITFLAILCLRRPVAPTEVAERLADYKAPDRVEFAGELPLNPVMKVHKQALARKVAEITGSVR
jgi:non-ribosomal peptide synthetase component E (peptide arylation enzyme)